MKTNFRYSLFIIILLITLCFVRPVLAHGGEPRLEISLEKLNPGGVIDLRGVDFESEELISLVLIGSGVEIQFDEITADSEGIFLQIITLPADLPEGTYYFRAVTDDHEILSPEILIQGSAIINKAIEGQRDEEDEPLFAPMPTFVPGAVPTQPTLAEFPAEPVSNRNQNVITVSVLVVMGIFIVFGLRRMKKG